MSIVIKIERISTGWASHRLTLYINGDEVKYMDYLYYTKREMIKKFKEYTGIKGRHGIEIVEVTK